MKKFIALIAIFGLAGFAFLNAERYKIEEKEKIEKVFQFKDSKDQREFRLDNIWGAITLEGYGGSEVRMLAYKTIKAKDQSRLEWARKEVTLDVTEEGNIIDLYVDGPFRCRDEEGNHINWRNPGYYVQYDFEIKVPQKVNLYLRTVNKGDILVSNVDGEFDIKNVNGKIDLKNVAGAGDAHTVNGWVKVNFTRNPGSDCSFHTINGDLEIFFPKTPSAEFRLKTFNGDAYSDFPVEYLPFNPGKGERKEGKYVFKSSRFVGVKSGQGGPEIKLDTFNGDIILAQKNK